MNETFLQRVIESREFQFIAFLVVGGALEWLRGLSQRTKDAKAKEEAQSEATRAKAKEQELEERARCLDENEQKFAILKEDLIRIRSERDRACSEKEKIEIVVKSLEADKYSQSETIQTCKFNEHLTRIQLSDARDLVDEILEHHEQADCKDETCTALASRAKKILEQDAAFTGSKDE